MTIPLISMLLVLSGFVFAQRAKPDPVTKIPKAIMSIPVVRQFASRKSKCPTIQNQVIDRKRYATLVKDELCDSMMIWDVDFDKYTLITYRSGGRCIAYSNATVSKSAHKYIVGIEEFPGFCERDDSVRGWLVIEKIPNDSKVEFITKSLHQSPAKTLQRRFKTREVDLKGCVSLTGVDEIVIHDKETYVKMIRNDAQRGSCLKRVNELDFKQSTLIGKHLNTGYCRRPARLRHWFTRNQNGKTFILNIEYLKPTGRCRALSSYNLWVLAPKMPTVYELEVIVEPVK